MDLQYPPDKHNGKAAQQIAFAKDAGVSWSTVQRALDPEAGKTLDIIADIAVALGITASELLSANLGTAQPTVASVPFKKADSTENHPQSPDSSRSSTS